MVETDVFCNSDPGGDREKYRGKPKREAPNTQRFTLGRTPFRMRGEVQLTELLPGEFFEAYGVKRRNVGEQTWALCRICNGVEESEKCEISGEKKLAICHECLEKFSKAPLYLSAATLLRAIDLWEPEEFKEPDWQPFDDDEQGEFHQDPDSDEASWT